MKKKRVKDSSVVMTQQMHPQDSNPAGNVYGGVIMKLIDTAAGAVAVRHARSNVVTASIDRLDFHNPVFVGELVTLRAGINMVGTTSMEVGVRVESDNLVTGDVRHTASAYLTFVALDESAHPMEIPKLILGSDEERRRNKDAAARRKLRTQGEKKERKQQNRTTGSLS
jgi:uncharacterized protein (TIGR00369 family)